MAGVTYSEQEAMGLALQEASARLSAVLAAGAHGGIAMLSKVGPLLVSKIRASMGAGGGITYTTKHGTHTASAPGEPPAVDTGKYRASFDWRGGGSGTAAFVEVGTSDKRGPWLEYGTSKMAARPHFRPAVEELTQEILAMIVEATAAGERAAIGGFGKSLSGMTGGFSGTLGKLL